MKPLKADRWSAIVQMMGPGGSVLDIGCRDKQLAAHLPATKRYVGFDLFPPADVIGTAEEPLPFADDEIDIVVLADVLEHLDDPHTALEEAMRVASTSVVLVLPNLYTLWLRVQYLRGITASKYEFGPDRVVDRHRWVLNIDQAAAFAGGVALRAGWWVAEERGWIRRWNRKPARAAYAVARLVGSPNLWAWGYAARLEPRP